MICVTCNFYDAYGAGVECHRCVLVNQDPKNAVPGVVASSRPLCRLTESLKKEIDWLFSQKET